MRVALRLLVCSIMVFCLCASRAVETPVVSHILITSDKIEDVSSIEAWKKSFIKDGMSDEQKAMAVWTSVVKFRQQDIPPNEFLLNEGHPHDAIKCFNVYGYGQCCCASANISQLARYAGLKARGWGIINHSVPEVEFEGKWRMLDASLITYFPQADGKPAGVEELAAGIMKWYRENPDFKGNEKKLDAFMRNKGWKNGPPVLANCPSYDDNGWFPAATHGWYSTMGEYADRAKMFHYEYGYTQGYQLNVQLRPGDKLTRNWSNKGLHINMLDGKTPGSLKTEGGKGDQRYAPKYGDLSPGRIGNGVHEYAVPAELLKQANADRKLEVRMPSSYVYLGGKIDLVATGDGPIVISFSDNNGLDWKEISKHKGSASIDLKPLIFRRFDYRVKFEMSGAIKLDGLKFTHDIQHSQRALPALDKGTNTITFNAGPDEGTITIDGGTNPDHKEKNLRISDYHAVVNGMNGGPLFLTGGKGDLTFPIATPGDMKRLRFGCHYRARDKDDGLDLQVSFDEGKSFKTVDRAAGPFAGNCKYIVVSDIPAGTRAAQIRYSGNQKNTTGILDLRIDADYKEPAGALRPVKITYVWDEAGTEKKLEHVAKTPHETFKIECAQKPMMKSLIVELAP